MKCPVCLSSMISMGGENKKDYGCSNVARCSSFTEANYHPHISLQYQWYFIESYHLAFKSGNKWYCAIGPEREWDANGFKDRTFLKPLNVSTGLYNGFSLSLPTTSSSGSSLVSIPYFALPANEDFLEQFGILVEKLLGRLTIK